MSDTSVRVSKVLGIARFAAFGTVVAGFMVTAAAVDIVYRDKNRKRQLLSQLVSSYSRLGLKIFNLKVNYSNLPSDMQGQFLVSNHLSYIDIVCIAARMPVCFVTSVEVSEMPGLGYLAKLASCLFVERRDKSNLSREVANVTNALMTGTNVCVFPEATSTNGEQVLRFRRPLFQAAVDANVSIRPLTINYRFIKGEKVTLLNRDTVCWYDDMPFIPHVFNLLARGPIEIDIEVHAPLRAESGVPLEDLSVKSHQLVRESYSPIASL